MRLMEILILSVELIVEAIVGRVIVGLNGTREGEASFFREDELTESGSSFGSGSSISANTEEWQNHRFGF